MAFNKNVTVVALLSFLLNAPFAIGEFLTRDISGPRTEFPLSLFMYMWLEMSLVMYLCMTVIRNFRQGTVRPLWLLVQLPVIGILGWAWVALIIDQWTCFFLGGSGC